ncbi:hypothetical protein [Streptomyces sp. NPDC058989]|uniref:hypothetical protein n=1 Tax=Streptomyces sp. NPDC058989 TaxID=3346686 RepID=UPI00367A2861
MEQTMTKLPEREADLIRQVNVFLEQHPIEQALRDLLSPHKLQLAEQSALTTALHAAPGDPRATEYYPHERPDGSRGHLMGPS